MMFFSRYGRCAYWLRYQLAFGCLCACAMLSYAGAPFAASAEFALANRIEYADHHDDLIEDASLSLANVVVLTMEKYPDIRWLQALEEEARAVKQRSESWLAGAPQAGLRFQEATSGSLHYIDGYVQVPLWNLGQQSAEQRMGEKAFVSAERQSAAIKLRIAGLVRVTLWDIALQKIRYEQALAEVDIYGKILAKVQRRVELGDLARSDVLLAHSELLQKHSVLNLAEAELMHARKRYSSITQANKIPVMYQEKLAGVQEVQATHPELQALSSQIERKQADLDALKKQGSGQTNVSVGVNSDRFTTDPRSNKTESFNIGVTYPFGGTVHAQPHIAAANVKLNALMSEREQMLRNLQQLHHEAEHNLEVNRIELSIANELQQVAEQHLKIAQLSFASGEINLMDLLKIQSRTQQAIFNAKERAVMTLRDQALYNQAVGVLP